MENFLNELRSLIGSPPAGFEFLEYVVLTVILLFLLDSAVGLVAAVFKWIGGGK